MGSQPPITNNCDLYAHNLLACVWDTVPFVKQFTLCYRTVLCLSVTLVYCSQTVAWIKAKLCSGHIVLNGPSCPTPRGHCPTPRQFSTLVRCGPTAGWIKMPLGTEIGFGPGDTVLDGNPAPPKRGTTAIFGGYLLLPNGWMDQDSTWHGCRPRPRPHCARWGPSSPQNGAVPPIFAPCLMWPNN